MWTPNQPARGSVSSASSVSTPPAVHPNEVVAARAPPNRSAARPKLTRPTIGMRPITRRRPPLAAAEATVDRERDLVGGHGEDGQGRQEVCQPEGPERARSERVPQRRINSPAGSLAPLLARLRPRSFIVALLWISSADPDDRNEDAQGAHTQNGARDAPAQGRDQPLSQRAGHEHPKSPCPKRPRRPLSRAAPDRKSVV